MLLVSFGCGSVASRITGAYGKARSSEGVRFDADLIAHAPGLDAKPPRPPIIAVPMLFIDLAPFAVIDLKPFDLARERKTESPQ
jgi:uncharacterized protein YceK